jgi:energy-coupling factor transporter transmembrane protein EcfT
MSTYNNGAVGAISAVFVLFYLVILVVCLIGTAKVISKAGYSGWFVLVSFVPLLNLVMFLVFAFSQWPIERRLEAAERASRAGSWDGPFSPTARRDWGSPQGPGDAGPNSW